MIVLTNVTHFLKYKQTEFNFKMLKSINATVSHDMRGPLSSVAAMAQILLGMTQEARFREMLTAMRNATTFLLVQVNDLLDNSLLEKGLFTPKFEIIEIRGIVEDVVNVVKIQATTNKVELLFKVHRQVPNCMKVDNSRLQQVLLNLLTNAIKFSRDGKVHIDVEFLETEEKLLIKVTDTGIGISKEDCQKLFKPFAKLKAGASLNPNGTGLGLSICKKICKSLKGDIWVKSPAYTNPETGTCFTFTMQAEAIMERESRRNRSADSSGEIEVEVHDASIVEIKDESGHEIDDIEMSQRSDLNAVADNEALVNMRVVAAAAPIVNSKRPKSIERPKSKKIARMNHRKNPTRKRKVLIAEDSQINLTLLRYFFHKEFGFADNEVTVCKDGGEALKLIIKNLKEANPKVDAEGAQLIGTNERSPTGSDSSNK